MTNLKRAEKMALLEVVHGLLSMMNGICWALTPWRWSDKWQRTAGPLDRAIAKVTVAQIRMTMGK